MKGIYMASRNTTQNQLIKDAVNKLHIHPTADEVYDYIHESNPSISRCTVYRNLNKLANEKQILKVEVISGADRYDYRVDKHQHAKCKMCGKVYDIELDELPNIIPQIKDTNGFEIETYDVIFKGLCPSCRQNKKGVNE